MPLAVLQDRTWQIWGFMKTVIKIENKFGTIIEALGIKIYYLQQKAHF